MIERPVSGKKVMLCPICRESIIERVTNKGKTFYASVYSSDGNHVIMVKNGFEVEHLCLTIVPKRARFK